MKAQVWVLKRKRKKGVTYAVQWIEPRTGRRRTEKAGKDKAYAQQIASQRRQELAQGLVVGITRISYDDFKTEHLQAIEGYLSPATYDSHERILRKFKETCRPKDLTVIDYAMIEQFRQARIADKVAPATVNKDLRTLQSILGRAVKRNYLKSNPFVGNRRALHVKEPDPEPKVIPFDDYQKLLGACHTDKWRAILTIAYYGGLRRGEILALEWKDVDFDSGMLRVCNKDDHATKSRKYRQVPMAAQVVEALKRLQPFRFKNKLVFPNQLGRKMTNNFDRDYGLISKKAGLLNDKGNPLYSMHDLRRSCATELQRQGVPMKTAQRILGHSDLSTTAKYYTGVEEKDLREAIKKLEERTA